MKFSFEWDEHKARTNRQKHRIDFADAAAVFQDDLAVTVADDDSAEDRYVTLGMDALGRVLVVAYTVRGELIRIISPRRATSRERAQYKESRS
ncbi:MAG: BrnT family toxin [Candidatus Binataceae bacterium]